MAGNQKKKKSINISPKVIQNFLKKLPLGLPGKRVDVDEHQNKENQNRQNINNIKIIDKVTNKDCNNFRQLPSKNYYIYR